jgi:hypothetical protein
LPSRSVAGSIAGHCDRRRDEEGERKDQQGGMRFDRNRLSRCSTTCTIPTPPAQSATDAARNLYTVITDANAHIRFAFLADLSKFPVQVL